MKSEKMEPHRPCSRFNSIIYFDASGSFADLIKNVLFRGSALTTDTLDITFYPLRACVSSDFNLISFNSLP